MSFSILPPKDPSPVEAPPAAPPRRSVLVESVGPTVRYWLGLDSHVYAMAIAANVLFGFFPFLLLLLSVSQNWLGWSGAERAVYIGLRAFLPEDPGLVSFVERNLRAAVASRGNRVEIVSIFLLILASNGIFMPLEVALNRLWGIAENRPYWKNQLMAFGMTFVSGVLAVTVALWAGWQGSTVERLIGGTAPDRATLIAFKLAEVHALIAIFVLVYWLLPNGPVPFKRAATTGVVVGLLIEAGQIAYSWLWPWLDLRREYGPFFISVTLVLWGFLAAMVVLAAGEVCPRPGLPKPPAGKPPESAPPPEPASAG